MHCTKHETVVFSFVPTLAAAVFLLLVCAVFSGCYTLTQGAAMLNYLGRAVPLESLVGPDGDNETEEMAETRRFVERVQDIRHFASDELGLTMSRNFTRYVQLDRDYLASVVSASAADSFTPHLWRFPIVGAVPYKGFFNVNDAIRERARLERRGLDVWIRQVDAFSTLGWFSDPLFSYMRNYPVDRLADLIIHESLHATVFLRNQVPFNEELAEFVGSEGARLYMESRFGIDSDEYRDMITREEDHLSFLAFIRELISELEMLYASGASREKTLYEKERIITEAQQRFVAEYENRFIGDNYRGFSTMSINNAFLELYRLYYADDHFMANLFQKSGKSLPEFITAAKSMPRRGPAGRERLAQALGLLP
jgi:predicted aminopeptidase